MHGWSTATSCYVNRVIPTSLTIQVIYAQMHDSCNISVLTAGTTYVYAQDGLSVGRHATGQRDRTIRDCRPNL